MVDKNKALLWLNEKWQGEKTCPICHSNNWSISDQFVELREFAGGNLRLGGPVYPLFSLTCKNCGHTLLFNALLAKLIKPEEKIIDNKYSPDTKGTNDV